MEEDFRFNQEGGWTGKLTAEHVPQQFVGELETSLSKGESPWVRIADHLREQLMGMAPDTTLYKLSRQCTEELVKNEHQIQYIKGTRSLPEAKLLGAVILSCGTVGIPLIDLRHLTREEDLARRECEQTLKEIAEQTGRIQRLTARFHDARKDTFYATQKIIQQMESIAIQYIEMRERALSSLPQVRSEDIMFLRNTFTDMQLDASPNRAFIGERRNVKIKFNPDRVPSKMHPDHVGRVFSVGDFKIVIDHTSTPLKSPLNILNKPVLALHILAKEARRGLTHPHMQRGGAVGAWYKCDPCWGSYEAHKKQLCESGDIIGLLRLVEDYLTSCSESGWYGSVFYWAPEELRQLYCRCGKVKAQSDEGTTLCTACDTTPGDYDIEIRSAGDDEEEEEEEEEEEVPSA